MRLQTQLDLASKALGVKVLRQTDEKGKSPCPKCGGDDRFLSWLFELNGTCMRCGYHVRWGDVDKQVIAQIKKEKQTTAIQLRKKMHGNTDWHKYADHPLALDLWAKEGVSTQSCNKYGLGHNPAFRIKDGNDFVEVPTMTMPNFYKGRLMDIRHRLMIPEKDQVRLGKYRSHLPKLMPFPFLADNICTEKPVVIMEGGKKAIIVDQYQNDPDCAMLVSGIPGVQMVEYVLFILGRKEVRNKIYWMLDPDQPTSVSVALARQTADLGFPSYVCHTFMKPDDMVREFGIETFYASINQAIKV